MKLGAQFFTLREQCQDLDGFAESLKKVADIGYKYVQISGTCAYEPTWLKEQLDKNGLSCVLTHIPAARVRDEVEQVIADHEVFGCKHIGIGVSPQFKLLGEDMQETIDLAKTSGRKMYEAGHLLMYHNHNMELARDTADRRSRLEVLADATTAEELGFTLDTYWVQAGGGFITDLTAKLKGRLPCVHAKDLAPHMDDFVNKMPRMAPVGHGALDWNRLLPAFADAGTEYVIVEQDNTYDEDPFACLKKSYDFLKAQGLE